MSTYPQTGTWRCANCGAYVPMGQQHSCPTTTWINPPPLPSPAELRIAVALERIAKALEEIATQAMTALQPEHPQ